MTYAEVLAYLYARLPMFQRIGPAAYKADLGTTHALMDRLGHPERGLRCVHVAGTNGKGSTSHLIASALQEAGYAVGLHTSPHLNDLRERFRINGQMVGEADVTTFVERYRDVFEPLDPSFFEWGVAFAFWWFRERRVDIAVIETGMGGRLDSTNVVNPEVSVITNIGMDHTQFLGDSLVAIAGEKAGIIKPAVPVVVGEAAGSVANVFRERASLVDAPITFVDQASPLPLPTALRGSHQQRNARTALAALHILRQRGWQLPEEAIARGFAGVITNTGLRGRWEVIGREPLSIADVAHNADGLRVVKTMLEDTPHERLHIVLGMVKDKDIAQSLCALDPTATYYFCKAAIPRGMEATELRRQAEAFGLRGTAYPSVQQAYHTARGTAGRADLILVTGSVFVVAEVL